MTLLENAGRCLSSSMLQRQAERLRDWTGTSLQGLLVVMLVGMVVV
jgi:hypothetical protein